MITSSFGLSTLRCRFALASWRIRSEELLGPNSSILEHVAGAGHMIDDIIRHGPSNIWEDDDGLLPHERAMRLLHSHMRFSTSRLSERTLEDECQPWHSESVCVVTTQKDANLIWEMASDNRSTICASNVLRTGIGIGSKWSKVCTIQRGLKVYLTRFWRESEATSRDEEIPEISDRIVQLKTLLIRGKVFKPGDHVIVLDETRADLVDGDILALEMEEWRDRNFLFAPSTIDHPPPYPELHDILLACHADDCRFTKVKTCVVRRIETEDGETSDDIPQVMEDELDCTSPRNFTVVAYSGDKPIKWISGG
ncbi:hypothetical protein R1sor_014203 [Riccia sorocarpa]|uniref:Uncharacterized protein n=1 Tax=Riccia sorocarpa TaxID=122646 RepID=A0ABD3HCL2_9MARC